MLFFCNIFFESEIQKYFKISYLVQACSNDLKEKNVI